MDFLMSLEKIIRMIPPPRVPIFAGDKSAWKEIQEALGCALPNSLEEYGRTYGSGYFDSGHSIEIFNPFDPAYSNAIKLECEVYESLREDSPEFCPFDCFPNEGGI